jgi:hypothetical protein
MKKPLKPLIDGRDKGGRFAAGNRGGPGHPYGAKVARLRAALLDAVSEADVKAIVAELIAQAKDGDVVAARELLDRVLGKPSPTELLERIEALELSAAERKTNVA